MSWYYLLKRLSFPLWVIFVKNLLSIHVWINFCIIRYHWSNANTTLVYYSFMASKSEGLSPLILFFFKTVLVTLGPLHTHMNFTIIVLIFTPQKVCFDFYGSCMKSINQSVVCHRNNTDISNSLAQLSII